MAGESGGKNYDPETGEEDTIEEERKESHEERCLPHFLLYS